MRQSRFLLCREIVIVHSTQAPQVSHPTSLAESKCRTDLNLAAHFSPSCVKVEVNGGAARQSL